MIICMVYNRTKSGLNVSLFLLSLPYQQWLQWVDEWWLDCCWWTMITKACSWTFVPSKLAEIVLVDLSHLFPKLSKNESQTVYGVWLRNTMGLRISPYCSCQTVLPAKRLIMGDRREEKNTYHWDHIQEILFFLEDYDANIPMLQKVGTDNELVSEVLQYINDLKIIAYSLEMV